MLNFQVSSTEHRLLISNLKVASTGIDLDDKHGDYPRKCYASPNYIISDLHQLTRRFLRMDTKSTAVVRFVYGKCGRRETSILNALARKSTVLKETLPTQVENGVHFPGEYDEEVECDQFESESADEIANSRPETPDTPPSTSSAAVHPDNNYTSKYSSIIESSIHNEPHNRLNISPTIGIDLDNLVKNIRALKVV